MFCIRVTFNREILRTKFLNANIRLLSGITDPRFATERFISFNNSCFYVRRGAATCFLTSFIGIYIDSILAKMYEADRKGTCCNRQSLNPSATEAAGENFYLTLSFQAVFKRIKADLLYSILRINLCDDLYRSSVFYMLTTTNCC